MARPTLRLFDWPSRSASSDLSAFPETRNLLTATMDRQERNPLAPALDLSLALAPHRALEPQEARGRAHLGVDLNLSLAPPGLNLPLAPEPQRAGGVAPLDLNLPPPGMDLNLSQGGLPLIADAHGADAETTESVNNY